MSLFADYLKERTDIFIIESPSGFVTYQYLPCGKVVYITEIYVIPSERKKGVASDLANLVAEKARQSGCTHLQGSVVPSTRGSTASLKVLLAYGMTLYSADVNMIYFRKEL